ncbi:MAG: DUF3883 domain-containing protein [Candidatus Binatia bacterium]
MPELGPDLCYSCQELLTLVSEGDLELAYFKGRSVRSVSTEVVLATCQECNWIAFDKRGRITLTETGREIGGRLSEEKNAEALQLQIVSMVRTYNWVWTAALPRGREDAFRRMPEDAKQCFRECNAMDRRWPKELIKLWDNFSKDQRRVQADENLEVGRRAEELSFEFERRRIGKRPEWRSLESESDGYDILSRQSRGSNDRLRIEVKGTSAAASSAEFSITRHQWETAKVSGDYVFHLWALGRKNILSIVTAAAIEPHVPTDRSKGKWQTFRVKFGLFFADARKLVDFAPMGTLRTSIPKRVQRQFLAQIS